MKPSLGRIVIYNTTEKDRDFLRKSGVNCSEKLASIICGGVFDSETYTSLFVNLKVIVDANIGELWFAGIKQGDDEGQWNWPIIEK